MVKPKPDISCAKKTGHFHLLTTFKFLFKFLFFSVLGVNQSWSDTRRFRREQTTISNFLYVPFVLPNRSIIPDA
jgi:hypothetical protein